MRGIIAMAMGVVLLVAAGCGQPAKHHVESTGGHEHGSGPHGGAVGDFGKDQHIEFTVDHGEREATIYILGSDVKTAAPIKSETLTLAIADPAFTVELKAARQASDPPGTASRFVAKHEKFGQVQEFEGKVTGVVDGQTLTGAFKEEPEPKK